MRKIIICSKCYGGDAVHESYLNHECFKSDCDGVYVDILG